MTYRDDKQNQRKEYENKMHNPPPNIRNYPPSRYRTYDLLFYLRQTIDLKYGLFRGQEEYFENGLLPKIFRPSNEKNEIIFKNEKLLETEKKVIKLFKDRAIPQLEFIPKDKDVLQWLAIAQHYGLRTRLLDWTQNALIALWFCVKNGEPKETIKKVVKA